jgi:hypothetical protein
MTIKIGRVGQSGRSPVPAHLTGQSGRSPVPAHLTIGLVGFATLVALHSASCSGAPKKEPEIQSQTLEEFEQNTPEPDDPCYGSGGSPIECDDASDCCKGFACSIDPAQSHVRRFCLEG